MGLTPIEWTNYTHNLWWGCTKVGGDPACEGCYAEDRADNPFWWGKEEFFPVWGADAERRFFMEKHYAEPFKWNRKAEKEGKYAFVFCMSMGDWAEGRPDQKPYLDKHLFPVIEATPWLIWLLLTKRPTIAAKIVPEHWQRDGWPKNAWPGITAVTQKWLDIRAPQLLAIKAECNFISAEPLVEALILRPEWIGRRELFACQACGEEFGEGEQDNGKCPHCLKGYGDPSGVCDDPRIGWMITGGMSGPNATPSHPDWFRGLRDQCVAADMPFHFKQHGEWLRHEEACDILGPDHPQLSDGQRCTKHKARLAALEGNTFVRVGKKKAGRILDGRTWGERPEPRP